MNEIVNPVHRLGPEQTTKFLLAPGADMERYADGELPRSRAGLACTSAIVHEACEVGDGQWAGAAGLGGLETHETLGRGIGSPGEGPALAQAQVQSRMRRVPSSSSRSTSTAQSKRSRHAKSPCRKLATARALGMGAGAVTASTARWTSPGGRSNHQRTRGTDRVCFSRNQIAKIGCVNNLVRAL